VGIKISILQGTATGSAVYAETHSPLTNANGLTTLEIGGGIVLSGNFATINWANGPFFVKTETDLNGGSNYTITNTSQLLSVPYALYANTTSSSVSSSGDTLFIGNAAYIVPGISAANNSGGGQTGITAHSCGATNVHNPAKIYGTMTDQQGNVYKTIVIGTQEWMAENLKTSIYRNGDPIANLSDIDWATSTIGSWRYYNNDSQPECPYGKLYNWYAVGDSRNVCPTGWHVPSDTEWSDLIGFLDSNYESNAYQTSQSIIAGYKLKSTGSQYWTSPNQSVTNESGFSGLPGGVIFGNTQSYSASDRGFWWSSTDGGNYGPWCRLLFYNGGGVSRLTNPKQDGFSIRCLRD
jgi:uncharacterized protein (TIGR02145 family)